MLSTRPLDTDGRALTKTPERALLKSRTTALQENAILHTTRPVSRSRPSTRRFGDITPFPNHTNPNHPEPHPSSTRKHPRALRQSCETPVATDHHWDVSDVSVDVPAVSARPIEEAVAEEVHGDVEHVVWAVVALACSCPVDDAPAPVVKFIGADVDSSAFEEDDMYSPFANFVPLSKSHPMCVLSCRECFSSCYERSVSSYGK
ncbi:hypothetical protein BV22DRAFT_1135236 [Leucogyrophana mollusca]|uniref:Uncharacterized protein n=1 Tax=Leucogyrophana mollusca TaxID=85980 RepID=A0ACB8AW70_9AGAM|nr:hypothetical protein BV22DRAFT_1135236 [Leucogyrophana mollusca]